MLRVLPAFFSCGLVCLLAGQQKTQASPSPSPQTWAPPKTETAEQESERKKVQQSITGEGTQNSKNWTGPGDLVAFLAKYNSQAATNTAEQPPDVKTEGTNLPVKAVDRHIAEAACRPVTSYESSSLINPGLDAANVSQLIKFGKLHSGNATNYGFDHMTGACGMQYMAEGKRFLGTAVGIKDWYGGLTCGACVEIDPKSAGSPGIKTIAQVTNACPECKDGLDLEDQTFIAMAGHQGGREAIHWRFIPCPPFKTNMEFWTGGNQYDLKIVVRNMAGAIVKLEAQSDGSTEWTPLEKMDTMHWSVKGQNFEAMHAIAGKGLINLRMTGIDGQQIVQTKISMKVDKWQMGSVQFGPMSTKASTSCGVSSGYPPLPDDSDSTEPSPPETNSSSVNPTTKPTDTNSPTSETGPADKQPDISAPKDKSTTNPPNTTQPDTATNPPTSTGRNDDSTANPPSTNLHTKLPDTTNSPTATPNSNDTSTIDPSTPTDTTSPTKSTEEKKTQETYTSVPANTTTEPSPPAPPSSGSKRCKAKTRKRKRLVTG